MSSGRPGAAFYGGELETQLVPMLHFVDLFIQMLNILSQFFTQEYRNPVTTKMF